MENNRNQTWRPRPRRQQMPISDVKQKNMASIDSLSDLPDSALVHILSFLPTKLSVSTSVLGRRWRFLWAHVPILDLDSKYERIKKTGATFSEIIYKVMLLHKRQELHTFRLSLTDDCRDFELEAWIATLISRSVRNLYISLEYQVKLPRCLFNCKTLVELSLSHCGDIPNLTANVIFPALKKLELYRVTYESDESLDRLLSACPVLEDLHVERKDTLASCFISSTTLNNLMLVFGKGVFYVLKIDAPALRSLTLFESVSEEISAGDLTSLDKATIFLQKYELVQDIALCSRSVIAFVGNMYNVKCLRLTTFEMEVPDSAFSALTMKFYNLTELKLNADYRFIPKFLENADNLEDFSIGMAFVDMKWREPKQVPACLVSKLRTIRIQDLECKEQQLSMVRYILKNAKVLKMMEIHSFRGTNKLETLKRISMFERGSEACQLAFD